MALLPNDLGLRVRIQTPAGWLELEDEQGGYEMHAEAFATQQVAHRKVDIEGDYVEGSYTVRSVRGQVTEALAVWVTGATSFDLATKVAALTAGLESISYVVEVTLGDSQETWTCSPADYTIESSQPFKFATVALVRATVPRLPAVSRIQVAV